MQIRHLAVPAVLLAAAVSAAPGAALALSLPLAFADAGDALKTTTSKSSDAVQAMLYQRLFDLRDKKNAKQISIETWGRIYRTYMDILKERSPGAMSEAEIMLAALTEERAPRSLASSEQIKLVEAFRELHGPNGSLRAMQDLDKEIAFVERKIASHAAKKP
ncbi:MAG: hypothetical protein HY923_06335 [Elusimicrobia bacterium]|nr:hypothetical protein [Elusimicrobiota bacterium]